MTTSRIYAYRWPARLVSHKPFAAESYSITPSCIWQVFFRKKNEFSFLFSPFCQRAHFLCKMHNPQAFLPVENSATPAVQCLVWTIRARVIPIIQGNPLSPLPLSGELSKPQALTERVSLPRGRFRRKQASASCRFPLRPLPVKKQTGKARRLCRFANIKNNFSSNIVRAKRRQFQIVTSSSAVPPAHPGA